MSVRCPAPASGPSYRGEFAGRAHIAPALSPTAWATITAPPSDAPATDLFVHADLVLAAAAGDRHGTMARANAAFPEHDPRKLTWDVLDALPAPAGRDIVEVEVAALQQVRALLAALLPPRGPAMGIG